MGKGKWFGRRSPAGKGVWDPKEAKPPRSPKQLEGPVTEYVSVVLKKIGGADDDATNVKIVVPGAMSFGAFTVRARQALDIGADRPLQLLVGPRSPDAAALMSSFPKKDFLYVSYAFR